MKSATLLLTTLLMLSLNTGYAQKYFPEYASYQKANLNVAMQRYLVALDSPNEGIVTATLAHVGRIKLYFPDLALPEVEKKICSLAASGETAKIRYRAFLICNVFNSPATYEKESRTEYEDCEELFTALEQTFDSTLTVSSIVR